MSEPENDTTQPAPEPAPPVPVAEAPEAPAEPEPPEVDPDREVRREIGRRTRRSFLVGAAASVAGLLGFRWLTTRRDDDGIPWPFRRALDVNEGLAGEYFSGARLAPT